MTVTIKADLKMILQSSLKGATFIPDIWKEPHGSIEVEASCTLKADYLKMKRSQLKGDIYTIDTISDQPPPHRVPHITDSKLHIPSIPQTPSNKNMWQLPVTKGFFQANVKMLSQSPFTDVIYTTYTVQ